MIEWTPKTPEEIDLIVKIANRASIILKRKKIDYLMDIELVHQTVGLRLTDFLEADTYDFWHDIFGITENLDRETGELKNNFVPRFAKVEVSHGQEV